MKKITFLALAVFALFTTAVIAQDFVLDESYGTAGKVSTYTDCNNSVMLEGNKLVVAAALAPLYNTTNPTIALKKYNEDGTTDTSFGVSGVGTFFPQNINSRYVISAIVVQPDGKFIVGGRTHIIGGFSYYYNFFLVRFNEDGTVDTNFGIAGEVTRSINTYQTIKELFNTIAIDGSGRILAAGYSENNTNNKADAVAMRFLPNGDTDTSFAQNGIFMLTLTETDSFSRIKPLGNSIYLSGSYTVTTTDMDIMVLKLNEDGSYDTSFGNAGTTSIDFDQGRDSASELYFKPDNKLMIVGSSTINTLNARIAFAQLDSLGNLDTTFSGDGKNIVPGTVPLHNSIGAKYVAQLPDGKFMIFSNSTRNDDSTNNYDYSVMRFNADTTLDTTFGTNGVFTAISTTTSEYAYGLQVQNDGKVLLLVYSWNSALVYTGSIYRYLDAYELNTQGFAASKTGVKLFPNPAIDILEIQSPELVTNVEVYDAKGARCYLANWNSNKVDIGNLSAGNYVVKVYTANTITTKKVIKQ